jgi:hypothetical protein
VRIRPAQPVDEPALVRFLEKWNALSVARRGVLEQPLAHGSLVAEADERLVAVLAYAIRGPDCEVMALYVDESRARLKPAIPSTGSHGIPLRDELELERELGRSAGRRAPGSG